MVVAKRNLGSATEVCGYRGHKAHSTAQKVLGAPAPRKNINWFLQIGGAGFAPTARMGSLQLQLQLQLV